MAQSKRASKTASKKGASTRGSRAQAVTTTDHDEIRRWAEARNGTPACVRGTGGKGDTGMLRIDFPGGAERSLQKISWEQWFDKFDEKGLAFLYQEKTVTGRSSRFNKLVSNESGGKKSLRAGS